MIVNSSTRINTLWRENIRAVVFCETDPIVGGSIGKVLFRTEQCTVPAAGLLKYGVRVSWCQNKTPRRALFSRSTQGDENDLNHIPQFYCWGSSSVENDWSKPPTRLISSAIINFCNLVIRCGDEGPLHLAGVDYLLLQHEKLSLHRIGLGLHDGELGGEGPVSSFAGCTHLVQLTTEDKVLRNAHTDGGQSKNGNRPRGAGGTSRSFIGGAFMIFFGAALVAIALKLTDAPRNPIWLWAVAGGIWLILRPRLPRPDPRPDRPVVYSRGPPAALHPSLAQPM